MVLWSTVVYAEKVDNHMIFTWLPTFVEGILILVGPVLFLRHTGTPERGRFSKLVGFAIRLMVAGSIWKLLLDDNSGKGWFLAIFLWCFIFLFLEYFRIGLNLAIYALGLVSILALVLIIYGLSDGYSACSAALLALGSKLLFKEHSNGARARTSGLGGAPRHDPRNTASLQKDH